MKQGEMNWVSYDGLPLFAQKWEPDGEIKGVINLIHGHGDHSGRFAHWAKRFNSAGYALVSFDLRGHGRSGGKRGHCPSFDHFADDITIMLQKSEELFPKIKPFLYGHSLGGIILLYFLIQRQPEVKGAIVTSPALRSKVQEQKAKVAMTLLLGSILPTLTIPTALEIDALSRDESVLNKYINDPLVHEKISLQLGKRTIGAIDFIFKNAAMINLPLLLLHGSDDRICYARGSEELASLIDKNCSFKLFEGCYHELHNEPEKDDVFNFLIGWINSQNG